LVNGPIHALALPTNPDSKEETKLFLYIHQITGLANLLGGSIPEETDQGAYRENDSLDTAMITFTSEFETTDISKLEKLLLRF